MSTSIGIIVFVALLVTALSTLVLSYANWQVVKQATVRWRAADRASRRRILIACAIQLAWIGAVITLLIIAPWGHRTTAYTFGGVGAFLVIAIPVYVALLARRDLRRVQRARTSAPISEEGEQPAR